MPYTTIDKPSDYFNTKLYTGNGSDGNAITGVGFQPDFFWTKARSQATYDHMIIDSSRGVSKNIRSNLSNAEATDTSNIASFDSDGFTLNQGGYVNGNGVTFASWNWKANAGTTSSNTDGSITSTVQANTTAGFSIVTYTGTGSNATVGHGLGVAPKMIIFKNRSSVKSWATYHSSIGATKFLFLNEAGGATTYSATFNDTEPTSSVFSVGTDLSTNVSSDNYIAYCFAEKKGYSKFGSYTGNGSTNGTYVHLGFKPDFFLSKRTDATDGWRIMDATRSPFNVAQHRLLADTTAAEFVGSSQDKDFLSNGAKIRNSDSGYNASGGTYIYMAFAENPFVTSTGIPCTAR